MSGFSYRRSLICGYYHELMAPLRKLSSRAHSRARDDQYLWRRENGWKECVYGSAQPTSLSNCHRLVDPGTGSTFCVLHTERFGPVCDHEFAPLTTVYSPFSPTKFSCGRCQSFLSSDAAEHVCWDCMSLTCNDAHSEV